MNNNRVRVGPNLYRDTESDQFFARRDVAGKTVGHDLETTVRKLAEAKRDAWLRGKATLAPDADKFTVGDLVGLWTATKAGTGESTRYNAEQRAQIFRDTFKGDGTRMKMAVAAVR